MDITRGSLEDISRPASSERVRIGSRVSTATGEGGSRIIRQNSASLEVLSTDAIQVFEAKSLTESISDEDAESNHLPKETSQTDVSDEENDDQELQKAIKKMKRLDKILAQKISKEKEVKKKGRELSQKLWQEFQELSVNGGNRDAVENTKLFLALKSSISQESDDEPDIVPVFGTQIPEQEYEKHVSHQGCMKVDQEQDKEGEAESRQTVDTTGKQSQNFVKKNIELVSCGQHVPMTLDERLRLCELLRDIDDKSQDHCSTAATTAQGTPSLCTTSMRLGKGYTPEPSELDQLIQIDARLQILLPHQDFLSVRSPYPDHNMPQVQELEQALAAVDSPFGERALLAQGERRRQEARLREIQQQLDAMEHSQPDSVEVPRLAEEQLQSLLLECELALSRSQSLGTHRSSLQGSFSTASEMEIEGDQSPPLSCTPRLSSTALSELLRKFQVTSASETPVGTSASSEAGERN